MRTVGVYEAKTHLSELLDAVERGESIIITRHGKPVAVLGPTEEIREEARKQRLARKIEDWKEISKDLTLGEGLTIRQLIEEGRKY